jgi:hypothetical protein
LDARLDEFKYARDSVGEMICSDGSRALIFHGISCSAFTQRVGDEGFHRFDQASSITQHVEIAVVANLPAALGIFAMIQKERLWAP